MEEIRPREVQDREQERIPRDSRQDVNVEYETAFIKRLDKISHRGLKNRVLARTRKIIENPLIGKPMRHNRVGTREVYIEPFRLSYSYNERMSLIIFLDLYHKDEQ